MIQGSRIKMPYVFSVAFFLGANPALRRHEQSELVKKSLRGYLLQSGLGQLDDKTVRF